MTDTRNDAEGRGKPRTDAARRIHASKDGCNGRPHTYWFRGPNKCDRLADLAAAQPPSGEPCRGKPEDRYLCAVHEGGYFRGLYQGGTRCTLALAAQPPSGDAPDLREALINLATASRNSFIVSVRYGQGNQTDEEMDAASRDLLDTTEAAFAALAASAPKGNR